MAIVKKSACSRCIFVPYNPVCLQGRQFPALLRQLVFVKLDGSALAIQSFCAYEVYNFNAADFRKGKVSC